MSQLERLVRMTREFRSGRCLTRRQLLDEFEISPAILKRDLAYLRDRSGTPIVFDRGAGGWRLDSTQPEAGAQYELPGLWLTAEEIHALLTMQHLLAQIDAGGLLRRQIEPLTRRLTQLLGEGTDHAADLTRRIRVQTVGARAVHLPHFQAVGSALLRRLRLVIDYHGRGRDAPTEREVSPQRLIHYRDNWYLDAWCHLRNGLRSYVVDAIRRVRLLDRKAVDVPDAELDDVLGAGSGIFAGTRRAVGDAALHARAGALGGGGKMASEAARAVRGRRHIPAGRAVCGSAGAGDGRAAACAGGGSAGAEGTATGRRRKDENRVAQAHVMSLTTVTMQPFARCAWIEKLHRCAAAMAPARNEPADAMTLAVCDPRQLVPLKTDAEPRRQTHARPSRARATPGAPEPGKASRKIGPAVRAWTRALRTV